MKDLLSKLFLDSYSFFESKNIDLPTALKITDIILLRLSINLEDSEELTSYINSFITLNNLLKNFFTLVDKENNLFDNDKVEKLKNNTKQTINFIEKRLEFYEKYEQELCLLVNKFRDTTQLKVA